MQTYCIVKYILFLIDMIYLVRSYILNDLFVRDKKLINLNVLITGC